jgi:hypothetical protein
MSYIPSLSTSHVANITVPELLWEMMPSLKHRPCRSSNICSPDGVTIVLELFTLYPLSLSCTTSVSSCHSYSSPCLCVFVASFFLFLLFWAYPVHAFHFLSLCVPTSTL